MDSKARAKAKRQHKVLVSKQIGRQQHKVRRTLSRKDLKSLRW